MLSLQDFYENDEYTRLGNELAQARQFYRSKENIDLLLNYLHEARTQPTVRSLVAAYDILTQRGYDLKNPPAAPPPAAPTHDSNGYTLSPYEFVNSLTTPKQIRELSPDTYRRWYSGTPEKAEAFKRRVHEIHEKHGTTQVWDWKKPKYA